MKNYLLLLLLLCGYLYPQNYRLEHVLSFSASNKAELEKVLGHYKNGDKLKAKAAEFLISNMDENKYWYEGDILKQYDRILYAFDSLRKQKVIEGDPPAIKAIWNNISVKYGFISDRNVKPKYDCQELKSTFLIKSIDQAFARWEKSGFYNPENFELFCEYLLPYRIQNEPVENYRERYYQKFKEMIDTISSAKKMIASINNELFWNEQYRASQLMWSYPLELSVSKMELGRRGSCRQLTTYTTLVLRACGIPSTIDRAVWANRSSGHEWNVIIQENGSIFPFDALEKDSLKFSYKPAKIFRKTFSNDTLVPASKEIPEEMIATDEKDVTGEYVKSYNVIIPVNYPNDRYKNYKYAVICVFDNNIWSPVYWGEVMDGKIHFNSMGSEVAYIAAFYDGYGIVPASEPFLLRSDGTMQQCKADSKQIMSMQLERKYPLFKRVEDFAWGVRRANLETADNCDFKNAVRLLSIYEIPRNMTEIIVDNNVKFRYVRLNIAAFREGNLAEIEFYGKKAPEAPEEKLSGKKIGFPVEDGNPNSYMHAMDGNLETWFQKPKKTEGWVGLDLGEGNERILTRVRYCPRSDTNFILQGDTYELFYWDNGKWQTLGKKVAEQYNSIAYDNVPSGTIYLLRDRTQGREERIFTYENGKQVWW